MNTSWDSSSIHAQGLCVYMYACSCICVSMSPCANLRLDAIVYVCFDYKWGVVW